MRILNWNTQAASPRSHSQKFTKIRQIIREANPDIVCLTEAYPETMPDGGETTASALSSWGNFEIAGARKVHLWSKSGWRDVDNIGSNQLPEGRYIKGITTINGVDLTVIGICIPYHAYRSTEKWAAKRKAIWQGACEFLDALRQDILSNETFHRQTIILGDFNLQIPPKKYPRAKDVVNQKREETFAGWSIPTSGELDNPALDKPFIDHVALTPDFQVTSMKFISRIDENKVVLTDHNGVIIEVQLNANGIMKLSTH